jgi:hypothetical protein
VAQPNDEQTGSRFETPSVIVLTRRWAFVTAGLAAGFSGLAVMSTILTGGSLLIAEAALGWAGCTICNRLPQVSSKAAVVTSPISVGSWVNLTPFDRSRSNSA